MPCLQGADDIMKIEVLKAGSTLSGAGDERFTLAALTLSEDPNLEVRQTVRYVYEDGQRGVLNLDAPAAPDPHLVSKVVEILKNGNPDSQAVVLPLLAALPSDSPWAQQPAGVRRIAFPARRTTAAGKLCFSPERGLVVQEPDEGDGSAAAGAGRAE